MTTDEEVRAGFGMRMKAAREAVDLTQDQVASYFGINKATVSAWETGRGMPDAMRLRRIIKLYKTSADGLLWDDSISIEALQFAAQFDGLTEKQQRTFKAMWLAYFEQAKSDEEVEQKMPATRALREFNEQAPYPAEAPSVGEEWIDSAPGSLEFSESLAEIEARESARRIDSEGRDAGRNVRKRHEA